MAYIQTRAKFIQITANDAGVFALDEQGYVWHLGALEVGHQQEWYSLPRRREGDAPTSPEPT
jgi:hypothetical protein